MTDNQTHWQIRLFNPAADFAQLLALRRELEALEPTGNDTSEEGLHAMLKIRGHDPTQDRWLVATPTEPEQLLAHAWLFAQSQERIVTSIHVHPAWRRQGIGSALLAPMLARARRASATHVTGGRWEPAQPAHHFLTHHGFEPVGHNRFFAAPADHDMWGHAENVPCAVDAARLAEGMRDSPAHYNPNAIFIVFAPDGDVAGVCFGRVYGYENNDPATGRPKLVVDSPGVVPAQRHWGLQRPLTLTTMHWLRNTVGAGPIQLYTYGDQEAAVAIYHELGFVLEPNSHLIEYRFNLAA